MMHRIPKFNIGDIITNGHYHFLIEGITYIGSDPYKYEWRNLEYDETNEGYVHIMDESESVQRVA